MTIYVDPLMKRGWKMRGWPVRNCHMFTDGPLDELHTLAAAIGMRRQWFQDKRVPHYDLTAARRRAAIEAGAVAIDRHQAVDIWSRIQVANHSPAPSAPAPQGNAAAGELTTLGSETGPGTSGANEGSNPSGRA